MTDEDRCALCGNDRRSSVVSTNLRNEWRLFVDARCAQLGCGQVRFHVSHEMDPERSPEGVQYHAEFAHHPFVEPSR